MKRALKLQRSVSILFGFSLWLACSTPTFEAAANGQNADPVSMAEEMVKHGGSTRLLEY